MVARYFSRSFMIKYVVILVHELKWPYWNSRSKVEGKGTKVQACSNAARS